MYECAGCGKPYSNMHDAAACCSNHPGMAPNTQPIQAEIVDRDEVNLGKVLEDQEELESR